VSDIDLSDEFITAYCLVEDEAASIFLTGKAGTGKSTWLRYLCEHSRKKIAVLAPTGIAALNVGGQTIHSFFRFSLDVLPHCYTSTAGNTLAMRQLDILVIDEVSMVRADLMDAIDMSLRRVRQEMDLPFGGVQVVLVGDLFQLPPVVGGGGLEKYFLDTYGGPYFFNAFVFQECGLDVVELQTVYRQTDPAFIDALNRIRSNNVDEAFIHELNRACFRLEPKDPDAIVLTSTNASATKRNRAALDALPWETYRYHATIAGKFPESAYPTQTLLELKKEARVMFVKNDTKEKKWVNGTLGTILTLDYDRIVVQTDSGNQVHVAPEEWEIHKYVYEPGQKKLSKAATGSFTQYPLRLAWAVTAHKAQGCTFDAVNIDFERGAFTHGQTYVALSRCRSLEGMSFHYPLQLRDVIFDPTIFSAHSLLTQHKPVENTENEEEEPDFSLAAT